MRQIDLTVVERSNYVLNTHLWLAALIRPESSFMKTIVKKCLLVLQESPIRSHKSVVIDDATKLLTNSGIYEPLITSLVTNEQYVFRYNRASRSIHSGSDDLK